LATSSDLAIGQYTDEAHAEDLDGLRTGEHGYKFRLVESVVMPPYVTPERYHLSRTLRTRPGDICYSSYPKSGSTWLAYILVLITNQGRIPSNRKTLRDCLQWVESSWTYPRSSDELEALPSPRIFKSHMPYGMALGGDPATNPCKYIYVARNPKDVAVSYFFFEREKSWSGHYAGSWDHWLDMFREGRAQRGSWFDHVLSWWEHRHLPNVLFLRYEDLRSNFMQELGRIVAFLDTRLDDEGLERIADMATFDKMKKEPFSNMHEIEEFGGFFRKGKVDSLRDQFTAKLSREFDLLYAERTAGSGLNINVA
jgi:hypothetical protein